LNLPELLKNIPKIPFRPYDAINLGAFLIANTKTIDYYQTQEWNGDTYVILKWPHKVPGLVVLP